MVVTLRMKLSALRRRMRKNATKGSAAIEFAFVAPVFFTMLFAIMETGIMFFGQFTLQNAVVEASRQIRTGGAQATNFATAARCSGSGGSGAYTSSQQWFTDQICCGISAMLSCTNLHVNVQNYSGGFGTGFTQSKDAAGNYLPATDAYNPGTACNVVLVRATYTWTVLTPVLSWFLVNMAGNAHLLSATTAFRTEPYSTTTGGC